MAQVAANKGIKISQDGTVYSEFLTRVQSKPEVWQGVLHAQKSLPTEVSNSIEAMFTSEGRKKGFLNSLTASVRKVVDYDASEKIIDVSEKIITSSPENVIALPTTSRVGAIIGGRFWKLNGRVGGIGIVCPYLPICPFLCPRPVLCPYLPAFYGTKSVHSRV